jgi:hypothetical protein
MRGRKVDFLTEIRRNRLRKGKRQPFQPTLFARISAVVREYRLTEDFVDRLAAGESHLALDVDRLIPGERQPLVIPLYALVTEDEYRVTRGILEKVFNPYLAFVQSPEDILFSVPLFAQNPALPPDRLVRWPFETLLLCELAKEEMQRLRAHEGTGLSEVIRKRVERLEAVVASVENEEHHGQ